mgnify:CR=1 FL=1
MDEMAAKMVNTPQKPAPPTATTGQPQLLHLWRIVSLFSAPTTPRATAPPPPRIKS